ncbi:N-acetylmuramidase domain-containing protein [Roseomonas xinghualingensis]|uniref:N-acetylmuramidase domain-containing protein n=1 Tax=Roseomonas xinghualingensis TaxID=2986475 RepID=UPI0021F0C7CC|nr:N-acetylmuramidase domain-containing protein [Roseomonas sp. SXEYE001]MCV4209580.1 N-acetylmuramidase domain-containing protein [Roseomonas sp. SXEYE001]
MSEVLVRGLTPADRARAAMALGVDVPTVQTVLTVETGNAGGFLADGRPRILLEAHLFSRATKRRWDASYPKISAQPWDRRLYVGGAGEWRRLDQAIALDRTAALRSCSWGLAQILGSNFGACGFDDVEAFVAAMSESEGRQLDAFVAFIIHEGLAPLLRARAWAAFARRYNGPGYAQNAYDQKLAAVYAELAGRPAPHLPIVGMLRIGMRGEAIRRLQEALNRGANRPPILVDGIFGRSTEIAVQQFQAARELDVDGVVGPVTAKALKL